MNVRWEDVDLLTWDAEHAAASASLQQDSAYGVAMQKLGVPVLRAQVELDGAPVALAQFIVRRFGSLGAVALCTRGPIWLKPLSPVDESHVYAALKKTIPLRGLRLVLFTPEIAPGQVHGLSPWRRVMTGMSTVMLDLTPTMDSLRAQLDKRWRHRLVGGEASEMKIHRVGTNPGQFRWVLETEMQQRSKKGLEGLPAEFFEHYVASRAQTAKTILTLRADMGRDRIAAMMFLIHGEAAIYHVGWTTDKGRDLHAHNLLLWKAMEELKSRSIRRLDLGGVNTLRSAGIARFKMSTGGEVITLAGTYF
jgi:hypothetical protein